MVPGLAIGGGSGESVRKRGWMCDWSFGPDGRRVGTAKGGVNDRVIGLLFPALGNVGLRGM